jgi:hypothetical protein
MVFLRGKQILKKSRDRWLDQARVLFSEPSSNVSREKIQAINGGREIGTARGGSSEIVRFV